MAQDQRIGSELGGYRIESLIGRAGWGSCIWPRTPWGEGGVWVAVDVP